MTDPKQRKTISSWVDKAIQSDLKPSEDDAHKRDVRVEKPE